MSDLPRPEAITRALPLLAAAPEAPAVARGYLDLLGDTAHEPPGAIQAFWQSSLGTVVYEPAQALARRLVSRLRPPESVLRLPSAARVLDVGCGPGNVTAELGEAAGEDGLALGLDVSTSMLDRAVRAYAAPNVGFVRADASRLPFESATFDAATCFAVLQLIPKPFVVLGEIARVLAPGGRLALLVPTPGGPLTGALARFVPSASGVTLLAADELADNLHAHGMTSVYARQSSVYLTVTATKAD